MQQRSSLSLYKFLRYQHYHFHHTPKASYHLSKTLPTNPITTQHQSEDPNFLKPTSYFYHSNIPRTSIFHFRTYTTKSNPEFDKDKIVDEINLKFAEAREEIEAAMESKETVYFNEEAECARAAVKEALGMFEGLLGRLEDKERDALRRSMGLKMEQLKAELQQLDE